MAISLQDLFARLEMEYGETHWWPGDSPFEVMVGAILTQNTSWTNVERAISNLKAAGMMSPSAISEVDLRELKRMIKPAGFYNQKARCLKSLARYIVVLHEGDVDKMGRIPTPRLRKDLLELEGIGPETADSILLYALGRASFVVDAYTHRLLRRLGFKTGSGYCEVKQTFEQSLGEDARKYSEMHALIVIHCKERCRKQPECDECPLSSVCPSYRKQQKQEITNNHG